MLDIWSANIIPQFVTFSLLTGLLKNSVFFLFVLFFYLLRKIYELQLIHISFYKS